MRCAVALGMLLLVLPHGPVLCAEDETAAEDPLRVTPTVKLIQRCLPAVVALQTYRATDKPGVFQVNAGSGAVIHPAGYILTNEHVVADAVQGFAAFPDNRIYPFAVVASFPHEDMALLKVNAERPLPSLELGRSHDLMLGEPVVVIGTPTGLAHTVSTGIVSGLNRNVATRHGALPVIQTNAAISGGSSGGPLINARGQQIGMINSRKTDGENLGFAIPVDRIRESIKRMIAPQERQGFEFGADLAMLNPRAQILSVAPESPAEKAGIKPGDVILQLDGAPVRQATDVLLDLLNKQAGQEMQVKLLRDSQEQNVSLKLAALRRPEPVAQQGLEQGLRRSVYQGDWAALPDFGRLKPVAVDNVKVPSAETPSSGGDHFGLRFTGFVKVPKDGLYAFATQSDDGSRLYIADRLVVDNDQLHAARQSMGILRLKAGLHPIVIDFFENSGDEVLKVFFQGPDLPRQEIPAEAFFAPPAAD